MSCVLCQEATPGVPQERWELNQLLLAAGALDDETGKDPSPSQRHTRHCEASRMAWLCLCWRSGGTSVTDYFLQSLISPHLSSKCYLLAKGHGPTYMISTHVWCQSPSVLHPAANLLSSMWCSKHKDFQLLFLLFTKCEKKILRQKCSEMRTSKN